MYDSIKEDSKIEFNYNSDNKQDESACIFCAVKVKDTGYFLIVCTNGNTIYDKVKRTYGLFDTTNHFKKGYYYDFPSEEFKMISCGRGICNMSLMFCNNKNLEKIIFLEGFNTENVTDMRGMFTNCFSLTNLNLSKFNTKNVIDMREMFNGCSKLTNLDLSNFNTSNVTNMSNMFYECSSLKELNLSNFNTGNVTYMDKMFDGCLAFKEKNIITKDKKIINMFKSK